MNELTVWLLSVADLFNDVMAAALDIPVLGFFLYALLFLVTVSVLAWLIRGRGGIGK